MGQPSPLIFQSPSPDGRVSLRLVLFVFGAETELGHISIDAWRRSVDLAQEREHRRVRRSWIWQAQEERVETEQDLAQVNPRPSMAIS